MKILSVAIPCYNSAEYMHKAIESCLVLKEDVEVIIVDDGSAKDNTAEVGARFAAEYPTICKFVHQENGGHGQAVNTGLKNATGLYFKVLDSDDWFNTDALVKMVDKIKSNIDKGEMLDLYIANYVYEKPSENKTSVVRYTSVMPTNKTITWNDIKGVRPDQNILMHSVIYRRELLLECKLELPKHTFYVDNIFVFAPLPYVKTLCYMDLDLYRYYIGREGQSVNEKIMISRIDQQIRVNKILMDVDILNVESPALRNYMLNFLAMICCVSTVLLIKSGTEENLAKEKELWTYLKEQKPELYKAVRKTLIGFLVQVDKCVLGRKLIVLVYSIAQRIFAFN